jgi:hypothetical protein
MRRLKIFFFIATLALIWQSLFSVKAVDCTGVGNYCVGTLIVSSQKVGAAETSEVSGTSEV